MLWEEELVKPDLVYVDCKDEINELLSEPLPKSLLLPVERALTEARLPMLVELARADKAAALRRRLGLQSANPTARAPREMT